eukprot:GDKJ01037025.1.p1 GENE.GDKJ01037025.1~~GDKJ01037025.1.p1  ORF type:complete len:496 (+),score=130.89 GDKJ01037025.1:58-1545(+)
MENGIRVQKDSEISQEIDFDFIFHTLIKRNASAEQHIKNLELEVKSLREEWLFEYQRCQMAEKIISALKKGIEIDDLPPRSEPPSQASSEEEKILIPCNECLQTLLDVYNTQRMTPSNMDLTLKKLQESLLEQPASEKIRPTCQPSFASTHYQHEDFPEVQHTSAQEEDRKEAMDQSQLLASSNRRSNTEESPCARPASPELPHKMTILSPFSMSQSRRDENGQIVRILPPSHLLVQLTSVSIPSASTLDVDGDNAIKTPSSADNGSFSFPHSSDFPENNSERKDKIERRIDSKNRSAKVDDDSALEEEWFGVAPANIKNLPLSSPTQRASKNTFQLDSPGDEQMETDGDETTPLPPLSRPCHRVASRTTSDHKRVFIEDENDQNRILSSSAAALNKQQHVSQKKKRRWSEPLASLGQVFLAHTILFVIAVLILLVLPQIFDLFLSSQMASPSCLNASSSFPPLPSKSSNHWRNMFDIFKFNNSGINTTAFTKKV